MSVPSVVRASPINGATDVTIDATIQFQFGAALLSTSVNAATVVVYDPDTLDYVKGQITYDSVSFTITFISAQAFRQNCVYTTAVVGVSSGSGSWITSSTGDALQDSYSVTFRTGIERYVSLEEVAKRDDVEYVGPIRAVSVTLPPKLATEEGQEFGTLKILSAAPKNLSTEAVTSLTEIRVKLNLPVVNLSSDLVELETYPALGDDVYLADKDAAGLVWLNSLCLPTGAYDVITPTGTLVGIAPPDFLNPTGVFSVDGQYLVWTRASNEPEFMYNQEIHVVLKPGLTGVYGATTGVVYDETEVVFTTSYYPKFIDQRLLRIELGSSVASLHDDTLNRIIHKNSIEAWELAAGNFNIDEPYPAVKRYVKVTSMLDVMDATSLTEGVIRDGSRKTLGDFTLVRGGGKVMDGLHPKYQKLMKDKQALERELRSYRGQYSIRTAIKGINTSEFNMDVRHRTWDNWQLWTYEGLIQAAANTTSERATKLSRSHDHGGFFRVNYGLGKGDGASSVFICRDKKRDR